MNKILIEGKLNTAVCYAKVVEDEAIEQIRRMCDYPMTEGSQIRIMPDIHSGKGCTIGTTMTITDKAVPIPLQLMKIHWTRHQWHTKDLRTLLMLSASQLMLLM